MTWSKPWRLADEQQRAQILVYVPKHPRKVLTLTELWWATQELGELRFSFLPRRAAA